MSVYLDCAATTPTDPRVAELMTKYLIEDFGNAGSRTHDFGRRARQAVETARQQIAWALGAEADELIFTGGATESNNLALLGLAPFGERMHRRHILSTRIEHRAVIEPLKALAARGFDVELLEPTPGGWISPQAIRDALRSDTLLVSVMHVNNETGVMQPITEIAEALLGHTAYFHVDAAQGFTKGSGLANSRVDMVSVNAHKIFGPKGVGALVTRKRDSEYPPLSPLQFGGGQERGLRPGTRPVALIAGFGLAAQLAVEERAERQQRCEAFRKRALQALEAINPQINGDPTRSLPHILNLSFTGIESEAAIKALDGVIALSNGPACSDTYRPSHVLAAMGLPDDRIACALRMAWCHATPPVDWNLVLSRLRALLPANQRDPAELETERATT